MLVPSGYSEVLLSVLSKGRRELTHDLDGLILIYLAGYEYTGKPGYKEAQESGQSLHFVMERGHVNWVKRDPGTTYRRNWRVRPYNPIRNHLRIRRWWKFAGYYPGRAPRIRLYSIC